MNTRPPSLGPSDDGRDAEQSRRTATVALNTADSLYSHEAQSTIRMVETYSEFAELKETWNRLADQAPIPSVFLRHEWFDAAWNALDRTTRPLILTISSMGKVVCICPLALTRKRRVPGGRRHLTFFIVPDTQECDLLIDRNHEEIALHALANWLAQGPRVWDTLELGYMPEETRHRDQLVRLLGAHRIPSSPIADTVNYAVNVTGDWDEYYAGISRRARKNVNLSANRVHRADSVVLIREDGTLDCEGSLRDAIQVSSRSWKRDLGLTLDARRPGAFIKKLTHHASDLRWLSLWILYVDAAPIAMEYQLAYGGRVHALRADFDEACASTSPGLYVHHQQLQALFGEAGTHQYLMGPGPNPYKLRWTTDLPVLQGLRAWAPTPRGSTFRLWDVNLRPILGQLYRWLQRKIPKQENTE